MFQVKELRGLFYFKHVHLRNTCDLITKEGIKKDLHLIIDALGTLSENNPNVEVVSLITHCGAHDLLGDEEIKDITLDI